MGIDPSGYFYYDGSGQQQASPIVTKPKATLIQSFREAYAKSISKSSTTASSNFYTDYYTKKANTPAIIHNTAEYYQYMYGKPQQDVYIMPDGEVIVRNPYPYGLLWVSQEVYNCMKDVEEGRGIELDSLSDDAVSELLEVVDSASEHYDEQRNLFENGSKEDKELEKLYSTFNNLYYDVNKESKLREKEEKQRQVAARTEEREEENAELLQIIDEYFQEEYKNYVPGSLGMINEKLPYANPTTKYLSDGGAKTFNAIEAVAEDLIVSGIIYVSLGAVDESKLPEAQKIIITGGIFVVEHVVGPVLGEFIGESPKSYAAGETIVLQINVNFGNQNHDVRYQVEVRDDGTILSYPSGSTNRKFTGFNEKGD